MGCDNSKDGPASRSSGRESTLHQNGNAAATGGAKGDKKGNNGGHGTSEKYKDTDDNTNKYEDDSSPLASMPRGSVNSNSSHSAMDSASKRSSHNSVRLPALTKGALGRNGRDTSMADSHQSLGSPKESFHSSKHGKQSGRYHNLETYNDMDDSKSIASMSDRESVMTSETFDVLAGKKVNRPRSAKGHVAVEPSAAEMKARVTRHGMKILLSEVDDEEVEPASMIRVANWHKLLTEKRRNAKSLDHLKETHMPGLVDIVDINNQTGDKSLDDVLSLMSYFPCAEEEERSIGADGVPGSKGGKKSSHTAAPIPGGKPKKFLDMTDPIKQVEEGSDDEDEEEEKEKGETDDDMRRTSFLVKPGGGREGMTSAGEASASGELPAAVGRFHFSEHKKLHRYYERHVKPWILDYLFAREEIDVSLPPVGPSPLPSGPGAPVLRAVSPSSNAGDGNTGDPSSTLTGAGGVRLGFSTNTEFNSSHPSANGDGKGPAASRTTNDSGEEPGQSSVTNINAFAQPDPGPLKEQVSRNPSAPQLREDEVMAMMM